MQCFVMQDYHVKEISLNSEQTLGVEHFLLTLAWKKQSSLKTRLSRMAITIDAQIFLYGFPWPQRPALSKNVLLQSKKSLKISAWKIFFVLYFIDVRYGFATLKKLMEDWLLGCQNISQICVCLNSRREALALCLCKIMFWSTISNKLIRHFSDKQSLCKRHSDDTVECVYFQNWKWSGAQTGPSFQSEERSSVVWPHPLMQPEVLVPITKGCKAYEHLCCSSAVLCHNALGIFRITHLKIKNLLFSSEEAEQWSLNAG